MDHALDLDHVTIEVPGEIGVIGFGDLAIAAMVEPAITTVRIDGSRIADRVIEPHRLHQEIPARRIDCGFEIVARESA